jgi:radical SAM/Cys-rich protein
MVEKQRNKSLSYRNNELSDSFFQLKVLTGQEQKGVNIPSFISRVKELGEFPLKPVGIDVFQLNIGKLCNQVCRHCHVDAGPDKIRENMSREHLERCLEIITSTPGITTVDITGGAPELHKDFRWFVQECRKLGKTVMNRCNLTIILANKKFHDLPEFFKENQVHLVSSLPYFSKNRTDSQRGDGVFEDSIKALQMLNEVGYGKEGTGLILDLVYNPTGAFLPAGQETLEPEFKRQLKRKFDIVFNSLFAITNLPISRFLEYLIETDNYEEYMEALSEAFNPSTVSGVMCRNMVSVSWDGYIYDCDFNQMLDLKVVDKNTQHIRDFDAATLLNRDIILNQHCYGCTAGAGSSCGGEIS